MLIVTAGRLHLWKQHNDLSQSWKLNQISLNVNNMYWQWHKCFQSNQPTTQAATVICTFYDMQHICVKSRNTWNLRPIEAYLCLTVTCQNLSIFICLLHATSTALIKVIYIRSSIYIFLFPFVLQSKKSHIKIHEDAGGGIYCVGVTTRPVHSPEDVSSECGRYVCNLLV